MSTRRINKDDEAAVEVAEEAAQAELPPPGHERRESLKRREESLQEEIDRVASQMLSGQVDAKKLEIVNEIANQTQYLTVSNPQPGFEYGWVSKNRSGQHIQMAKAIGWEVVQGSDKEAVELKGSSRSQSGGEPDTTRQLGDVILMRIPRERFIVLQAKALADTKRKQRASAATLLEMGDKYRGRGIIVKPYMMADDDGDLGGPEIKPMRFSSRQQAVKEIDRRLRDGTIPGMTVNY